MDGLSRKQEIAMLDFYGLDTLTPQVWNEVDPSSNVASPIVQNEGEQSAQGSLNALAPNAADQAPRPIEWDRLEEDDTDPLGIKDSVLGTRQLKRRTINKKLRNTILVSSRDFDPKAFLVEVHRNTSYKDLELGFQRLQVAVEKRKETMKQLVKDNFDRFVGAKSTVEAIYKELKSKNLNSAGYGTEPFVKALNESTDIANAIFKPIIERKMKAEKIRSTLNVLERYKFFFNLPASLKTSIEKGKFDQAVHDYRKGKTLYQSHLTNNEQQKTGLAELGSTPVSPVRNGLLPVFEKVWAEVERVVVTLHKRLFNELSDMTLAMDVQERNMIFLIDLDATEDPVWFYLNAQFKWIMALLQEEHSDFQAQLLTLSSSYFEQVDQTQKPRGTPKGDQDDDQNVKQIKSHQRQKYLDSLRFRKAIHAVKAHEYDIVFGRDIDTRAWSLMLNYVKNMGEIITACLPDFWKLSRACMERKFHSKADRAVDKAKVRRMAVDFKKGEQSQHMFNQILERFANNLGDTFHFVSGSKYESEESAPVTTIVNPSSGSQPPSPTKPTANAPTVALTSASASGSLTKAGATESGGGSLSTKYLFLSHLRENSIAACLYLPQVVLELATCFQECSKSIRIPHSVSATEMMIQTHTQGNSGTSLLPLSQLVEKLKRGFVEMLCASWVRESSTFYTHEDWLLDAETRASTELISLFNQFQKLTMCSLFQVVATMKLQDALDSQPPKKSMFHSTSLDRIRSSFTESIYTFLDGLHFLAFHPNAWSHWTLATTGRGHVDDEAILNIMENIRADASKKDTRLLVILGNLASFQQCVLPILLRVFEDLFRTTLLSEMGNITGTVKHLDGLLFDAYIKRKTEKLSDIIQEGILFSGIDWRRATFPSDVSGYVNEALLYLVLIHSEITSILGVQASSSITPVLFSRIFSSLLRHILQTFLECFRQIDAFTENGGAVQAMIDVEAVQEVLQVNVENMSESQGLMKLIATSVGADNCSDQTVDRQKALVKTWIHSCEVEFMCFL